MTRTRYNLLGRKLVEAPVHDLINIAEIVDDMEEESNVKAH